MKDQKAESLDGRFRQTALSDPSDLGTLAEIGKRESRGERVRRGWLRGRRVRYIPQVQQADCGPTALASILDYFGLNVDLAELRTRAGAGRDGVSARTLIETASRYGVDGRGLRVTLEGLRQLPRGTMLFWGFNHFVVLEGVVGRTLHIVDPASGQRIVSWADADALFTGIAIEFSPGISLAGRTRRRTSPRSTDWRRLSFFVPKSRAWIWSAFASLLLLGLNLVLPFATGQLVNSTSKSATAVWVLAIAVVGLGAAYLVLQILRATAIAQIQAISEKVATTRLFGALLRLPFGYFALRHPADLAHRLRTSSRIRTAISGTIISSLFDILLIGGYLVLLLFQSLAFGGIVLSLGAAVVLVIALTWRSQWQMATAYLDSQVRSATLTMELLESMQTVKAIGAESAAMTRWQNIFAREVSAGNRYRRGGAIVSAIVSTIQYVSPLAVLVLGYGMYLSREVSLGEVVTFSTLSLGFLGPVGSVAIASLQIAMLAPELSRVGDIIDAEPEPMGDLGAAPLENMRISLSHVNFKYPGARANAISDVSVDIAEGSYTGVIGPSGSGKSTLGHIMAGMYPPDVGQVLIGGFESSHFDVRAQRQRIGYVDQNSRLFAGSLRENLTLASPEASLEDIERVCNLAGLLDVVNSMPMRFETMLGAGGAGLSGGQRQRVALARCLLRNPELLILDEATSAVDPDAERNIFENLRALDATLVVIAHRLSLVDSADQVIVMNRGRVQLSGPVADVRAARDVPLGVLL